MTEAQNPDLALDPTPELIKACIAALAQQDPQFKAALLANPRAAIESALGEPLPAMIEINVVQEGPNSYTVVLPYDAPVGADGELADADLESVAGGAKSGAAQFALKVGRKALAGATGGTVQLGADGRVGLDFGPAFADLINGRARP